MSFKPLFAYKILGKAMDCEVRTYFGEIREDDIVLVYASSPIRAILGYFKAGKSFTGTYKTIVEILKRECMMFDEDNWNFIKRYQHSKRKLLLLKIREPTPLKNPISLHKLRIYGIKQPPRSYSIIEINTVKKIIGEQFH